MRMKKSAKVTLTVVAVVGLASCNRRHPDPCEAASFNEQACQQAVQSGGYYYNNTWFPMVYHYPYPYYYDSYRSFSSHGGTVTSEPAASYSHAGSGVERGGFGSSGASHSGGGSSSGGAGE
jgi:uncharacterized membrane protein YgcG